MGYRAYMDSSILARNVVASVQETTAGVYPASFKEGSRHPRAMMECARTGPNGFEAWESAPYDGLPVRGSHLSAINLISSHRGRAHSLRGWEISKHRLASYGLIVRATHAQSPGDPRQLVRQGHGRPVRGDALRQRPAPAEQAVLGGLTAGQGGAGAVNQEHSEIIALAVLGQVAQPGLATAAPLPGRESEPGGYGRPVLNCRPSPTRASQARAITGPIPGIRGKTRLAGRSRSSRRIHSSASSTWASAARHSQ
jgi:hypothetical protein